MSVAGGEGDKDVAAVVFITAAGARQTEAGSLRQACALMRQQRRIGGQADHNRTHARMRQRGSQKRRIDLLHIAPDRVAVDPQFIANAVVGLNDRAHRPAALSAAQPARRVADAALEFMADHAAAPAHGTLLYCPSRGVLHGLSDVLGLDVETVDVVDQAVIGFQYHRHVPVETSVVRLMLSIQRNQRITHHAEAVGVGEGNRAGQQTRLTNPLKPGGVAIAVEHMHPGETRLLVGRALAWFDQGNAGADVATGAGATAHVAMTDAHTWHIGDGIERAGGELADADVEVSGAWFHGFRLFLAEIRKAG